MKKKTVALLLACVMALGVAIGGTMAWLTATTTPVQNTFTVGDINIDLTETDANVGIDTDTNDEANEYHFVPGDTLPKDPKVTVEANSEACYLFVKIEELNNIIPNSNPADQIIDWSVNLRKASDSQTVNVTWNHYGTYMNPTTKNTTQLWYCEVPETDVDLEWYILANNTVTVDTDVTKAMVETINDLANKGENAVGPARPQLIVNAAAVQSAYLDLAGAWKELPDGFVTNFTAPASTPTP